MKTTSPLILLFIIVGLGAFPACNSLFYKECEPVPPDSSYQAQLPDRSVEIQVWKNVPIDSYTLHLIRPLQSIEHPTYQKLLDTLNISEDLSQNSGDEKWVGASYYFKEPFQIEHLWGPHKIEALLIYFVRDKTLHTRFFQSHSDTLDLIETLHATPKYFSLSDSYIALPLISSPADTISIFTMVDPSEANKAIKGQPMDLRQKFSLIK